MESGKKGGKGCAAIAYHGNEAAFDTAFLGQGGEASVKVGNLPPETSPEELCEAFASQGIDSMTDCYIPQGRKFGFLRFATLAEGKMALNRRLAIRGHELEMEFAQGKKRSSEEMAGFSQGGVRPAPAARESPMWAPQAFVGKGAPDDPGISQDAPSIKVSSVPPGTSSDELHKAVLAAGCRGAITDVYIPKGDRGFGFVRFSGMRDAEAAANLQVFLRGAPVELEISVSQRKGPKEMAGQGFGGDAAFANGGFGYGAEMAFGGYGPAKGFGCGKMGPYGGKGPKGYW